MIVLTACNNQIRTQPTLTVSSSFEGQSVNGIILFYEEFDVDIGPNAIIINSRDDILNNSGLVYSRLNNDIIFTSNMRFNSGENARYGTTFLPRLCHAPPDSMPHVIMVDAYPVMEVGSPDNDWYIFAGSEVICDHHLYAYNLQTYEIADITPEVDKSICSYTNMVWQPDDNRLNLSFSIWSGGSPQDNGSYTSLEIPFKPLN